MATRTAPRGGFTEDPSLDGVRAEFRTALQEEIAAAKEAAATSGIPLIGGQRIGQLAESFQYVFSATSALNVPSDAPGELVVPGRKPVSGSVISVEGLKVTLSVTEDLGEQIHEATLRSDMVFLLKKLIQRIEDSRDEPNPAGSRLLGEAPPSGVPHPIDDSELNDTQDAALGSALGRDTTFIWGPPGTGKTKTIGAIGEQLYRTRRSVLLVSHTNKAVDQALLQIAEKLGGDLSEGKLLRLGVPTDQRLREREDLLLDSAVRARQQALHARQDELRSRKQRHEERIGECDRLLRVHTWATEGKAGIRGLHARVSEIRAEQAKASRTAARITELAGDEQELREHLERAEGIAKRSHDAKQAEVGLGRLRAERERCQQAFDEAGRGIEETRNDYDKSLDLRPLFDRERSLPGRDEQRRKVDGLAGREAQAAQAAAETAARFADAETTLEAATRANAIRRRLRSLPKAEQQEQVVLEARGEASGAESRRAALRQRLESASEILAELEELDAQLGPYRHLSDPEDLHARLKQREAAYSARTAELTRLEQRDSELRERLADAASAVDAFVREQGVSADAVVEQVKPVLDNLEQLRSEEVASTSRAKEFDDDLKQDLRNGLDVLERLGLIDSAAVTDSQEALARIDNAFFEAQREAEGIDTVPLNREIAALREEIRSIDSELRMIEEELEATRRTVVAEAMVIGTTLTRAYLWDELQERRFDTVILDEASMAPIPALWVVARLAGANVVLVGDFKQLPPIKQSEHPLAEKWLGRDVFDVCGIPGAVESDDPPAHLVQLDEQYRMHPQISAIPNALIYGNRLRDTPEAESDEGLRGWFRRDWGPDNPVLLLDTGATNAWTSPVAAGGRSSHINFVSAVISVDLAGRLLADDAPVLPPGAAPRIIIGTPYRPQARLLKLLIRDAGLDRVVEAGTAHQFQGSEAPVVIFDLAIDEPAFKFALAIPERDPSSERLLNVALTRAQDRLFLVGDFSYIKKIGKRSFLGGRLIPFMEERYPKVPADEVVSVGLGASAARAQALLAGGTVEASHEREVMTQSEVYPRLLDDFSRASERIVIYSPFMTSNRLGQVLPQLRAAVERGVEVFVFTKSLEPPDRRKSEIANYQAMEKRLSSTGIRVIHKPRMHEKLVFIDRDIAWTGSLNVLSFRDTQEWMGRWKSPDVVKDFSRPLRLDDVLQLYSTQDAKCPVCGSELVPKEGLHGPFLRCIVRGCYTQDIDRPIPRDGKLVCGSCGGPVEYYEGGKNPVWRCKTNKRHRQTVHPNHLRLPEMCHLVVASVGPEGLARLKRRFEHRPRPGAGDGPDSPK
jgi:AAA domain-containing protein/phospholipase D-like protein